MIWLVGFTARFLLTYSATSISHIVNQDGDLVLDVTDEDHAADNVRTRSLLVNKSEASVQAVSQRSSTLGATGVRATDRVSSILKSQNYLNPLRVVIQLAAVKVQGLERQKRKPKNKFTVDVKSGSTEPLFLRLVCFLG